MVFLSCKSNGVGAFIFGEESVEKLLEAGDVIVTFTFFLTSFKVLGFGSPMEYAVALAAASFLSSLLVTSCIYLA